MIKSTKLPKVLRARYSYRGLDQVKVKTKRIKREPKLLSYVNNLSILIILVNKILWIVELQIIINILQQYINIFSTSIRANDQIIEELINELILDCKDYTLLNVEDRGSS